MKKASVEKIMEGFTYDFLDAVNWTAVEPLGFVHSILDL